MLQTMTQSAGIKPEGGAPKHAQRARGAEHGRHHPLAGLLMPGTDAPQLFHINSSVRSRDMHSEEKQMGLPAPKASV